MKEYNATLIDYGEGKGKLVVESKFGKVTFAVKADSHMWVELEKKNSDCPCNHCRAVGCSDSGIVCEKYQKWKEGEAE